MWKLAREWGPSDRAAFLEDLASEAAKLIAEYRDESGAIECRLSIAASTAQAGPRES